MKGIFGIREIAQHFDVAAKTVIQYRWRSAHGHYPIPFPEPSGVVGRSPYWHEDQIGQIEAWWYARPGFE